MAPALAHPEHPGGLARRRGVGFREWLSADSAAVRGIEEHIAVTKTQKEEEGESRKTASASSVKVLVRYVLVVPEEDAEGAQWRFPTGWDKETATDDHRGLAYCLQLLVHTTYAERRAKYGDEHLHMCMRQELDSLPKVQLAHLTALALDYHRDVMRAEGKGQKR